MTLQATTLDTRKKYHKLRCTYYITPLEHYTL